MEARRVGVGVASVVADLVVLPRRKLERVVGSFVVHVGSVAMAAGVGVVIFPDAVVVGLSPHLVHGRGVRLVLVGRRRRPRLVVGAAVVAIPVVVRSASAAAWRPLAAEVFPSAAAEAGAELEAHPSRLLPLFVSSGQAGYIDTAPRDGGSSITGWIAGLASGGCGVLML